MKKRSIIVAGVLLLAVAASTAAAVAVDRTGPERKLREGRLRDRHPGGMVLHTDGVAVRREGTTFEFRTQKGIIRAADNDSITVESPGDYTQTYTIDGDTRIRTGRRQAAAGDLKVGDAAAVHAVKSGNDYVARTIRSGPVGERLRELLEG